MVWGKYAQITNNPENDGEGWLVVVAAGFVASRCCAMSQAGFVHVAHLLAPQPCTVQCEHEHVVAAHAATRSSLLTLTCILLPHPAVAGCVNAVLLV